MHGARTSALAALFAIAWMGRAEAGVTLDAAAQKRLGVTVAPLVAARQASAAKGFARVLDPTPLVTLDSDLQTALAVAQASTAEAARTKALAAADATVSRRVAEAAAAQAKSDAAKVTLLRRRIALEWGRAFQSDGARARLLTDLAAARAALVRIDATAGVRDAAIVQLDLGQGRLVPVQILGPARTADSRLGTAGLIGVVRGSAAERLPVDFTASALLSGRSGGAEGVLVPRSAALRARGETFVYIRRDATHFERRELTAVAPRPEGLFASGGARPGELVVVSGAAALFGTEAPAKTED